MKRLYTFKKLLLQFVLLLLCDQVTIAQLGKSCGVCYAEQRLIDSLWKEFGRLDDIRASCETRKCELDIYLRHLETRITNFKKDKEEAKETMEIYCGLKVTNEMEVDLEMIKIKSGREDPHPQCLLAWKMFKYNRDNEIELTRDKESTIRIRDNLTTKLDQLRKDMEAVLKQKEQAGELFKECWERSKNLPKCMKCDGDKVVAVEEGKEVKNCTVCDGNGVEKPKPEGTYVTECRECDGQGEVRFKPEGTTLSECKECDGFGDERFKPAGSKITECKECGENGEIINEPEGTSVGECAECDDNGNLKYKQEGSWVSECKECDGQGAVKPKPEGTEVSECADCDGQGSIRFFPYGTYISECDICDGQGAIIHLEDDKELPDVVDEEDDDDGGGGDTENDPAKEFDSEGFDPDGYDAEGFDREGYNMEGYDIFGLDRDGWDSEGYDFYGFDKEGYNREGYDEDGYDKMGLDTNGLDREGYDLEGYDSDGFDMNGRDREGYNTEGFDEEGYDRQGYDIDGYNRDGYDANGYDMNGYDVNGYDINGFDANGYDIFGYNSEGVDINGYDRNGNPTDYTGYADNFWNFEKSEDERVLEANFKLGKTPIANLSNSFVAATLTTKINRSLKLGVGVYKTFFNPSQISEKGSVTPSGYRQMQYGGLLAEYALLKRNYIIADASCLIGLGYTKHYGTENQFNEKVRVFQPALKLQTNISKTLALGVDIGYRFVTNDSENLIWIKNASGPVIALSVGKNLIKWRK